MTTIQMGFDLKKLLKSASAYNQKTQETVIPIKEETEAEIILPVYAIDEETVVPVKKTQDGFTFSQKSSIKSPE